MHATITLEYDDEKTAEAIYRAVSPDNLETPPGLSVKTVRKDNNVITEINAETKIATFNATIDDLLFSASTAEKTLGIIKKSKPLKKRDSCKLKAYHSKEAYSTNEVFHWTQAKPQETR